MKKYFVRNRKWIVLLLLLTVGSAASVSLIPLMTQKVIENYQTFDRDKILVYAFSYVAAVLLFLLFEYLRKIVSWKFHRSYALQIKSDIFRKVTRMPHATIRSFEDGDIVNSIMNDTESVYDNYIDCSVSAVISVLSFLIYLGFMVYMNVWLALIIVVISFFSLLIPKVVGGKMSAKQKAKSDEEAALLGSLNGLLDGAELYDSKTSSAFRKKFDEEDTRYENKFYSLLSYQAFTQIFSGFSLYLINIVTFICGMVFVYFKLVDIASFIAMIGYIDLVAIPVRDMVFQVITLRSSKEIRLKLSRYLEDAGSEEGEPSFEKAESHVWHYEAGTFVLNDAKCILKKGESYAFIGENGAGKSTFVSLTAGERELKDGGVCIDGTERKSLPQAAVFYVSHAAIFEGSLQDNLTVYNTYPEVSEEVLEEAGIAYLAEKEIQYGGKNLSFGEKCRISLVRAVNSGKEILVLDEPFANVDEKSEASLTEWLLKQGRTVILITHNRKEDYLSQFDHVMEVGNGTVKEIRK